MTNTALLDRLGDPELYKPTPTRVDVVQTHISTVFLAPPYVYKVKKAKDLGFLDFREPTVRRQACRDEVALNRRLSDDVYLGIASLLADDDNLRWVDADRDDALEWAVKMRLLEPEGFLDRLLAAKAATPAHVQAAARRFAAFATAQEPAAAATAYAGHNALLHLCRDNIEALEPFTDRWVDAVWLSLSRRFVDGYIDTFATLLDARCARAVIDGHGDLHAQHIHFDGGSATGTLNIIDCIEFAPAFRIGDIVADEAFLLLDLKRLGHPDLADAWLAALREVRPDADRELLLPFYLHYRAMVRAKVASLRATSLEVPEFERPDAVRESVAYLKWAARFAVFGSAPTVLAMAGPSGSGKSTLAERLATLLGATRHSSDQIRRGLAGLAPDQDSGSPYGRGLYSAEMNERTYNTLIYSAVRDAEQAGLGIADATFLTPDLRDRLNKRCAEAGVRLVWLALDPDPSEAHRRLAARRGGESEANAAVLDAQLRRWRVPGADEGDMILILRSDEDVATVGQRLVRTHLDLLRRA